MKTLAIALSVMTLACALTALAEGTAAAGKEPVISPLSEVEKETIQKQVRDQFNQLMLAINQTDARAWSKHYSEDGFLSAFVRTDYYATRGAWVEAITSYFAARESQHVEPLAVQNGASMTRPVNSGPLSVMICSGKPRRTPSSGNQNPESECKR